MSQILNLLFVIIFSKRKNSYRGVNKGGAGVAIAPPYFGRIEGAAGQRRRAALLLAPPLLGSLLCQISQKDVNELVTCTVVKIWMNVHKIFWHSQNI